MQVSSGIEFCECNAGSSGGASGLGTNRKNALFEMGKIHNDPIANVAATHRTAGSAGYQGSSVFRRPTHQLF
jgi:hypothetical protein